MCTTVIMCSSSGRVRMLTELATWGMPRRTGRKTQEGKHWKSISSSQQHAAWWGGIDLPYPPSSFPVSSWRAQTSPAGNICLSPLSCKLAATGQPVVALPGTVPPGVTALTPATLLPAQHLQLQPHRPGDGERWVQLSLQPCTAAPGIREGGVSHLETSKRLLHLFFSAMWCIHTGTALLPAHRGQQGQISTRSHCWVVTRIAGVPCSCLVFALNFPTSLKNQCVLVLYACLPCCSALAGSRCCVQECK